MRGLLDAAVGVEQARRDQRVALGGARRQALEGAAVEQLDVGVEQHRHAGLYARQPGVVGRAEARVAIEDDHLGAALAREVGAAVARPGVDDHDRRPLSEMAVERVQQPREVVARVVQDTDDGEVAHPAAAARIPRSASAASRHEGSGGAAASSRSRSPSTRTSASASAAASPGAKRSAARSSVPS